MIDFNLIARFLPTLLYGAWVSIQIAALSTAIGITFGTLLGVLSCGPNKLLARLVLLYTTLVRGVPMLIQIMFVAYVLPEIGLKIPLFWGAVCAIGLNSSAYVCHIVRSGILSVDVGQIEAAQVLGLSRLQTTRYIVLPQAFRTILPALGNEFITLVKDSSLASTIGVVELTKSGSIVRSLTLDAVTVFSAVGLLYLAMTLTLSAVLNWFERRAVADADA